MPTQPTSGSQTATVTTEHTLATITTAGTYVLRVDTNAMVDGATPDLVELRAKVKTLTGSTSRQLYLATYIGAQTDAVKDSPPVVIVHEVVFTLKQTQGTGRVFDWSVVRVDA